MTHHHSSPAGSHVSYDFVSGKTHDGKTLRMLTLIDEYTRECLAIRVARRLGRYEVIEALADVMLSGEFRNAVHRAWKSLGERLLRKFSGTGKCGRFLKVNGAEVAEDIP